MVFAVFRGCFHGPIFLREAVDRIGVDDALAKIDALMDWSSFSPILKRGLGRSGVGPKVMIHWSCSSAC